MFLVDGNIESQVAIQEEIRARSIVIVNDAEEEVVMLSANADGGVIRVDNKDGEYVIFMSAAPNGGIGSVMTVKNKRGWHVDLSGLLPR